MFQQNCQCKWDIYFLNHSVFNSFQLLLRLYNITSIRVNEVDEQGVCQKTSRPFLKSSSDGTKALLINISYQLHN